MIRRTADPAQRAPGCADEQFLGLAVTAVDIFIDDDGRVGAQRQFGSILEHKGTSAGPIAPDFLGAVNWVALCQGACLPAHLHRDANRLAHLFGGFDGNWQYVTLATKANMRRLRHNPLFVMPSLSMF